ncbi:zinc finger MYM-type protein 1-like [Limulus polyphemus]|uniref:Zinc finger MYM-type protein 1-like n=1 Tax=Limulus polyphemus TaxID=6850 RepID=A0ABM1B8T2_LIMPO|nr:zinc finger MYM-type protein 1-like [Limulus polyphemus]
MNASIVKSIEYDGKQKRYFSKSMFYRSITNGEKIRSWLCYSPNTDKAFCFNCKLFTNSSKDHTFSKHGFSDWKNASQRSESPENSQGHRDATSTLTTRSRGIGYVNSLITRQSECDYMKTLLDRVVATIKILAERGLAFRGHNECIGSSNNGSFLGKLELLAQFDPFLATHIEHNGNKGKGSVSYLSSTVCDELIEMLGQKMLEKIILELKEAKHFSVSVDSTTDISHVDTRWSAHAKYYCHPRSGIRESKISIGKHC